MRFLFLLAVVFFVVAPARSQSVSPATPDVPDRGFKLLRQDEDWSFLADAAKRQDFWDPIKYIRLRTDREDWFMTIGGEAREVWEQIGNDDWGQQPFMNGYLNERYMLYFDVHYGKHVRTFIELKSGVNSYRIGGPRPIDEKKLDFQVGFLELGTSCGSNSISLRVGRQELEYGSGRLIDVREGPNVRLSFDGFMVKSRLDAWQVDGFAVRPDLDNPGFFDNAPNHAIGFWGVYATRPTSLMSHK
jgi:Alginate export